jgi:tetratricopeptide (TPR) repeat protein
MEKRRAFRGRGRRGSVVCLQEGKEVGKLPNERASGMKERKPAPLRLTILTGLGRFPKPLLLILSLLGPLSAGYKTPLPEKTPPGLWSTYYPKGMAAYRLGDLPHALEYLDKARWSEKNTPKKKRLDGHVVLADFTIAEILGMMENWNSVRYFNREAYKLAKSHLPDGKAHVARAIGNIAHLHDLTARNGDTTLIYHRRALILARESMDARNPELSRILNHFALHHLHFRRYGDARPLLEEAERIDRHRNRGRHSAYAYTLSNLALLSLAEKRYDDAQRYLEKGRKIMEPSPYHRDILGRLYYMQAALLSARGEYASAADFLQRAIAIYRGYIDPQFSKTNPKLFGWLKNRIVRMYTELASIDEVLGKRGDADAAYGEIFRYIRYYERIFPRGILGKQLFTSTGYDARRKLPKGLRRYFTPETPVIWSTLYSYNLRPNTTIGVTWSYRADSKSKWTPYYETRYRVSGTRAVPVGIRAPEGGFPVGEYRIVYRLSKKMHTTGYFIVIPGRSDPSTETPTPTDDPSSRKERP